MLLCFVDHPGALLDKNELLAEIWPNVSAAKGDLERTISTLRLALGGAPDDQRVIVTEPGGYRFIAGVASELHAGEEAPASDGLAENPAPVGQANTAAASIESRVSQRLILGSVVLLTLIPFLAYYFAGAEGPGQQLQPTSESAQVGNVSTQAGSTEGAPSVDVDDPRRALRAAERQVDGGNRAEAVSALRQYIAETPAPSAEAVRLYGRLLFEAGRIRDARSLLERARRLEPDAVETSYHLAQVLLTLGSIEAALDEAERGLAIGGHEEALQSVRYVAALAGGDRTAAARFLESHYGDRHPEARAGMLGAAELLTSSVGESAIRTVRAESSALGESPIHTTMLAQAAAASGEPELAIEILRHSPTSSIASFWLPHMSEMRRLEGLKALVRDAGLVDYWRAAGQWGDYCAPRDVDDFECF